MIEMFCEDDAESNSTDSKVRAPVLFNITEVSPTSEVTLTFSESLYSQDQFEQLKLNKTLFNEFRKGIINITYETILNGDIRPKLIDWKILSFTNQDLKIHLNFTNILFVSSDTIPDKLWIELKSNKFFVAKRDFKKMELVRH